MLSRLRISQRLPLSFAVVAVLLCVVIAGAYRTLTMIEAHMTRYSTIAENTQRMAQIDERFTELRRNVLRAANGDAEARGPLQSVVREISELGTTLIRELLSDERRRRVQEAVGLIREYEAGAQRVLELRQERDTLVTGSLDVIGLRMRSTLIETNGRSVSGRADGEVYTNALDAVMRTRIIASRAIGGQAEHAVRALAAADETVTALTALRDARSGAERSGVERVIADLALYRTALERFRTVLVESNELIDGPMRQLATRIDTVVTQLVEAQRAALATIREEAADGLASGTRSIMAVGAGALVCAALLAIFLVRGIVRPLGELAGAMNRLAGGDTSGAVPGRDRRDEIRAMADALAVFQDNAKALEQAEAEKKQQEARIAAERRRMMEELGAAVGSVVDAAARGDFSRRVDARFDDEELRQLGEGLNRLVGTVQDSLDDLMNVMRALGSGDLTTRVDKDYEGAFGVLASGTNGTAEKLAEVIGRIGSAASTLDSAAQEILSGANDLAQRTSTQAAMVEETAAAVEEFSTTVQTNASRASRASELARNAEVRAQEGGAVMKEAQGAMTRIDEASGRISEVVGLIENIAFQTNLLALNASVEAARAGEAGRGFAVVASEVRRLAQHASEASTEVKALISTSVGEVRSGVELVGRAGGSLSAIVGAINEVTSLMVEIAGASKEQAITINEIGTAVRKLDEMTQQNAALVEETNSAIHMTEQQVNALNGTVGEFRLTEPARPGLRRVA